MKVLEIIFIRVDLDPTSSDLPKNQILLFLNQILRVNVSTIFVLIILFLISSLLGIDRLLSLVIRFVRPLIISIEKVDVIII